MSHSNLLDRRRFLQAAAATVVLPAVKSLGQNPATLTVHSDQPGPTLPANYIGLSYEIEQLSDPSFFSASNNGLIEQFRALSPNGVLRLGGTEIDVQGGKRAEYSGANTQVDKSRTITIEFDANSRGPWEFSPEKRSVDVHPGELTTVMYTFRNVQNRTMAAQAIPSYAPMQAMPYFNKLECFCFNQYTLAPGEEKKWPVVFVIDPKLSKDVRTITLSYTFFEVGGRVPAEPAGRSAAAVVTAPAGPRS